VWLFIGPSSRSCWLATFALESPRFCFASRFGRLWKLELTDTSQSDFFAESQESTIGVDLVSCLQSCDQFTSHAFH
jgi:hypothetical protein